MRQASQSMNSKIFAASLAKEYLLKVKKRVFEVIRFNYIKRKRERIMGQIVIEKHQTLLILKSLEQWRHRLQFKYAKYNLLHQVERDQQMRVKGKVFDALREQVYL